MSNSKRFNNKLAISSFAAAVTLASGCGSSGGGGDSEAPAQDPNSGEYNNGFTWTQEALENGTIVRTINDSTGFTVSVIATSIDGTVSITRIDKETGNSQEVIDFANSDNETIVFRNESGEVTSSIEKTVDELGNETAKITDADGNTQVTAPDGVKTVTITDPETGTVTETVLQDDEVLEQTQTSTNPDTGVVTAVNVENIVDDITGEDSKIKTTTVTTPDGTVAVADSQGNSSITDPEGNVVEEIISEQSSGAQTLPALECGLIVPNLNVVEESAQNLALATKIDTPAGAALYAVLDETNNGCLTPARVEHASIAAGDYSYGVTDNPEGTMAVPLESFYNLGIIPDAQGEFVGLEQRKDFLALSFEGSNPATPGIYNNCFISLKTEFQGSMEGVFFDLENAPDEVEFLTYSVGLNGNPDAVERFTEAHASTGQPQCGVLNVNMPEFGAPP